MDPNKLTQKSQEAIAAAQSLAVRLGHQEVDGEHLAAALLDQPDGVVPRLLARMEAPVDALRAALRRGARAPAEGLRPRRRGGQGLRHPALPAGAAAGRGRGQAAQGRVRLGRAPRAGAARRAPAAPRRAKLFQRLGLDRDRFLAALQQVRGNQRVTTANPEVAYEALEQVRRRPGRAGAARQARPGDRPRRGDPPGDPHPLAQDQEQPGADRRAGRRQDRDRRGAGAAHRARRRPRGAQGPRRLRRSTWARCSPAPSTAASSRSA